MTTKQTRKSDLYWKSYDVNGDVWFSAQISLMDFSPVKSTDDARAIYIQKLLKGAVRLNSEFLSKWNGFDVKTTLEFSKDWGLGSSSTLTYLVAQWADVNPLLLHFKVSNGSGYDVACAGADFPINYKFEDDTINYSEIEFDPDFKDKLYFIYLNNKQSSNNAIEYYLKNAKQKKKLVSKLTNITESMMDCTSLSQFIKLMEDHESAIAEHLSLEKVKDRFFSDFIGGIKSLGAWGGDFILAASDIGEEAVKAYFSSKGYNTVLPYSEMILQEAKEELA